MLETLIDEASLRPIITPPNKAIYFDTNNLVTTPQSSYQTSREVVFLVLRVFPISLIHLFQGTLP